MELVAGGIENAKPGIGQASLQFFTARDGHHLVLAAVQDQHRLPDVAQATAKVVVLDRLVLADDRVKRHLAKVAGILCNPFGIAEDEMWLVEIRVASQRTRREAWDLWSRGCAPLATAVGRAQDEAADRIGPI